MPKTSKKYHIFLIYLLLAAATVIAFEPVRHNDFVNYDDPEYLTENQYVQGGIRLESIAFLICLLRVVMLLISA